MSLKQPSVGRSISVGLAEEMEVSMSKLWDKAVEYCLTHDDIEIFLLVCCWAFLGWMMFQAFNGVMERIYC